MAATESDIYYDLTPDEQAERAKELAAAALEHWGISDADIELLKYRENAVYSIVDTNTGTKYAMRIHRAGYHSDDALRSELQWMVALAEADIKVPPIIPTTNGELFVTVEHDSVPEPRQVDMLGWVEGEQIGTIENDQAFDADAAKQNYYIAGQLLARIHNQAESWTLPKGFTRRYWDEEGVMGDNAHFGCFWKLGLLSDEQREMLLNTRESVRQRLEAFGKSPDRFGLTHADFLPENLLADGDDMRIIDFDDCGFGWHMMDIATTLFFLTGEDSFDLARDAMVAGYRTERQLPDEHLDMLATFAVARGLSYLSWIQSRQETDTAKEIGPVLVELVCFVAEQFQAQQKDA